MTMASESALFMFVFTFCLAGAVALFVLAVFILLHRLLVDDKYVASKSRINIIIVGYILCILLCIAAAILIIIGLAGLHQGIKLVLRNQTDLGTVVNECPKSLTCQLEPVNSYLSQEIDNFFAKSMEALPDLKKRIDILFEQGSDAYNFWSNLRNANTSFNPLLAYGSEVKRLADEVERRNLIIKEALNKSLEKFVKSSCEIMEDTQRYKKRVDHYADENESSLRTEFRVPWLFLAIIVLLAICVCGIIILILRHYRYVGDSQSNKSQKHRVLFAVFDLAMELAGHLALFIAILAFLSACNFLFTAYSPEFLCVGIFGNNSLATLNMLHEYDVENMERNATDTNTFDETFRQCFARRSTYDSFVAQRWIFTEEFDNMFYSVNLDPVRDKLNEINVSFLIPQYESFYNFIKDNVNGQNIDYFTCGTDERANESLAKGKWNITIPGLMEKTPQVIQLMRDLPKVRVEFYRQSTALNDFRTIKAEGRKYLMTNTSENSPQCMLAIAWSNAGFGWCNVIPIALQRIFIGCVLIALAALLLGKFSFDTVDFIPFVPPSAQEVARTKSEVSLLTAEPLRLMPSLTNVSLLANVDAKELAKKKKKDKGKSSQEIHSDSREDFVPPKKDDATQGSEKVKKPVKRRSVYSTGANTATARLPPRSPPKLKKARNSLRLRPLPEDVTMDSNEPAPTPRTPSVKKTEEAPLKQQSAAVTSPGEKLPQPNSLKPSVGSSDSLPVKSVYLSPINGPPTQSSLSTPNPPTLSDNRARML